MNVRTLPCKIHERQKYIRVPGDYFQRHFSLYYGLSSHLKKNFKRKLASRLKIYRYSIYANKTGTESDENLNFYNWLAASRGGIIERRDEKRDERNCECWLSVGRDRQEIAESRVEGSTATFLCQCSTRKLRFASAFAGFALSRKGLAWPRRVRRAARSNRDEGFPSLGSRLLVLVPLPLIFLELRATRFTPSRDSPRSTSNAHSLRLPSSPIPSRIYARRYVPLSQVLFKSATIRDQK